MEEALILDWLADAFVCCDTFGKAFDPRVGEAYVKFLVPEYSLEQIQFGITKCVKNHSSFPTIKKVIEYIGSNSTDISYSVLIWLRPNHKKKHAFLRGFFSGMAMQDQSRFAPFSEEKIKSDEIISKNALKWLETFKNKK